MASSSSHPGWADIEACLSPSPQSTPSKSGSRPAWHYNDADVTDFGPATLSDDVTLVKCDECSRVVLQQAWGYHLQNCSLIKDIASGRASPSILAPLPTESERRISVTSLADSSDTPLSSSKVGPIRLSKKAEKEAAAAAKRLERERKKNEKLKGKKVVGPVDVDKQCGVINDKNLPCSRSLTCKSHSMRAKRDVPGRSESYDVLLLAWQKATNPAFLAKLEEKERAVALAAEAKARRLKEKGKKKKGAAAAAAAAAEEANAAAIAEDEEVWQSAEQVDEELDLILTALREAQSGEQTRALPLATPGYNGMFTTRKRKLMRCRELFRCALGGVPAGAQQAGSTPSSARLPSATSQTQPGSMWPSQSYPNVHDGAGAGGQHGNLQPNAWIPPTQPRPFAVPGQ